MQEKETEFPIGPQQTNLQRIPENYTAAPLSLSLSLSLTHYHHYQPVTLVSDFSAVPYRTLFFLRLHSIYYSFRSWILAKAQLHSMKRIPLPGVEPFDPSGRYFDWSVRGLTWGHGVFFSPAGEIVPTPSPLASRESFFSDAQWSIVALCTHGKTYCLTKCSN